MVYFKEGRAVHVQGLLGNDARAPGVLVEPPSDVEYLHCHSWNIKQGGSPKDQK